MKPLSPHHDDVFSKIHLLGVNTVQNVILKPQVLNPHLFSHAIDPNNAKKAPERAVRSSMVHRDLDTALASLSAISKLEHKLSRFYIDLTFTSLNQQAKPDLEELMNSKQYEYQSEFAKRYLT
ncbi:hypothetical protein [Pajaroellobacter abortibovis]|uniref:Uncharacterized protein n=1 Tax=Pajaroellobacter abortibovis TaxID=1882918 RepID=A0A1L6MXR8_9BACT|nr:hypothetical protein [Pajaroellobacter abortibovis]APS00279.1 hypothetical protein BCY86_05965 [Pajaroellobacter abortibovis]